MELGVGGATGVAPPQCVAPPQSSRLHSGVLALCCAFLPFIVLVHCLGLQSFLLLKDLITGLFLMSFILLPPLNEVIFVNVNAHQTNKQ